MIIIILISRNNFLTKFLEQRHKQINEDDYDKPFSFTIYYTLSYTYLILFMLDNIHIILKEYFL